MSSHAVPWDRRAAAARAGAGSSLARTVAAWITPDRVYQTVLTAGLFAIVVKRGIGDPDLPWHLRTGELVARLHWAPTRDAFSSHAGAPFVAYSWLAEIVMWLLATGVGFHALRIVTGAIAAWTFLLVYRTCRDLAAAPALALVATGVAGLATLPYVAERPTIVSFLLAAFFARRLGAYVRGRRVRLWPLVPATVLWANVHVFFVYAVGWVWLAAAWTFVRARLPGPATVARPTPLVAAAVAVTAATLVNPYGAGLLAHVRLLASHPAALPIVELGSPNFHLTESRIFLLFLLAFVAAIAWSSEPPEPYLFALALGNLALALDVQRNIPVFVILAAPLLARAASLTPVRALFTAPEHGMPPRHALAHAALAAVFVAIAVVRLPTAPALEANVSPRTWPFAAVRFLRAQPPLGRMANHYNWGGFLVWALPEYRVSIDGRATFYGEPEVLRAMKLIQLKPGWRGELERMAPDFVFWERRAPLATALAGDPGWTKVYADDLATIFLRADHPLRRVVKRAARRWLLPGPPPPASARPASARVSTF
ncbi:MAG TPA: hypothetical protein VFD84_05885 [Candidatus Binatia bacterium]|nr:hypothetical protein [Candidatus Binatia bacterium]